MAKQASKTVIGGFVISAIALLVIAVVVFGGGRFFKETERYVLFFDRSIKGLNVGSPVVFRGVRIGSVDSVVIRADTENLDFDIPVFIEIEMDRFQVVGEGQLPEGLNEQAKLWIDRGLRSQLSIESLVTGQLMVEMDFHPEAPARLTGIDLGCPELPTMPSDIDQLAQTLKNLPVEDIFNELRSVLTSADNVLSAPELMDTIKNLKTATASLNPLILNADHFVDDADKLVVQVGQKIDPLSNGLQETLGDARTFLQDTNVEVKRISKATQPALVSAKEALDQAKQTLQTYSGLVDDRSALRNTLTVALSEIGQAARSIRALTDYLEQHPEALIQGKSTD